MSGMTASVISPSSSVASKRDDDDTANAQISSNDNSEDHQENHSHTTTTTAKSWTPSETKKLSPPPNKTLLTEQLAAQRAEIRHLENEFHGKRANRDRLLEALGHTEQEMDELEQELQRTKERRLDLERRLQACLDNNARHQGHVTKVFCNSASAIVNAKKKKQQNLPPLRERSNVPQAWNRPRMIQRGKKPTPVLTEHPPKKTVKWQTAPLPVAPQTVSKPRPSSRNSSNNEKTHRSVGRDMEKALVRWFRRHDSAQRGPAAVGDSNFEVHSNGKNGNNKLYTAVFVDPLSGKRYLSGRCDEPQPYRHDLSTNLYWYTTREGAKRGAAAAAFRAVSRGRR